MSGLAASIASGARHAVRRLSSSSLIAADASSLTSNANINDKHVGILAIEVYTPSTYVKQEALEEHSGASPGKFTIGLGQDGLAVCGDAEDVNSLCLTVVHALLEK